MNGPGKNRGIVAVALALALGLPAAAPAQESGPLLKSDLVRMMTASNYTATEMAAIVRMNCVGFEPTDRDRSQLGNLPNADVVLAEVDRCMSRPRANRAASRPAPPAEEQVVKAPPRPRGNIDLTSFDVDDATAPIAKLERPSVDASGEAATATPVERETPPRLENWKDVSSAFLREYRPNVRQPGTVLLWLRVGPDGKVAEARVKRATGDPAMADAALAITDVMEFQPATLRDHPVESWTELPINFSSKK